MRRPYITQQQAETLARLFYGLGPRAYKGVPLPRQQLVFAALRRKRLINPHNLVTETGLRELQKYINHYGTRISGTRENAA